MHKKIIKLPKTTILHINPPSQDVGVFIKDHVIIIKKLIHNIKNAKVNDIVFFFLNMLDSKDSVNSILWYSSFWYIWLVNQICSIWRENQVEWFIVKITITPNRDINKLAKINIDDIV